MHLHAFHEFEKASAAILHERPRRHLSCGVLPAERSHGVRRCSEIMEAKELAERNAQLVLPMETMLATQVGLFEAAPESGTATTLGLWLNLLNVFLYMTNYNLVIPLLDDFCDHLGVANSVSGAVIGCADIMAIIVSVAYSVWTNHSYKQPLIFASIVCLVGNLLVTLAYDWGGLPLLFIGRLLTGTGAARALNRRYIADFVSVEGRTTASIGFVAASAAGMAAGPFAAVPLSALFDSSGDKWHVGPLTVNAITVSGWLMVALWAAFWVVAVVFEEPIDKSDSGDGDNDGGGDSAAVGLRHDSDEVEGAAQDLQVLVDRHERVDDEQESDVRQPLLGKASNEATAPSRWHGSAKHDGNANNGGAEDSKQCNGHAKAIGEQDQDGAGAGGGDAPVGAVGDGDGEASNGRAEPAPGAFDGTGPGFSSWQHEDSNDLDDDDVGDDKRSDATGGASGADKRDGTVAGQTEASRETADGAAAADRGGAHENTDAAMSKRDIQKAAQKCKACPKQGADCDDDSDEGGDDVQQRLLQSEHGDTAHDGDGDNQGEQKSWWQCILSDRHLAPTVACILMLFLLKLLQQGAVSSTPLFAGQFFGWDKSAVGLFMGGMSLAMLPVSFSVAAMTRLVRASPCSYKESHSNCVRAASCFVELLALPGNLACALCACLMCRHWCSASLCMCMGTERAPAAQTGTALLRAFHSVISVRSHRIALVTPSTCSPQGLRALCISDRMLMGVSLLFCGVGCLTMVSYTGEPLSMAGYIIAFTLILAFTNILEGVSMSILSKVIPEKLAKGTFNAGALASHVRVVLTLQAG